LFGKSIRLIADQREAHNAAIPVFSNRRFALLPSALLVEPLLRCQLGVLKLETGAAVSDPN